MNLKELFEMQRKLDEHIVREKGLEGRNLLPRKFLALQVELGELANEWRGFKFWSEDQTPRDNNHPNQLSGNPLLEEYVDCLHFILSIGLDLGQEDITFELPTLEISKHSQEVVIESFLNVIEVVTITRIVNCYKVVLICFFELGYFLGFTWEQIEKAYKEKNKVNHQRQVTGY